MKKTTGKTKNEDRNVLCCHQRNNEGRREGRIICRLVCAPSFCVYGPKKKGGPKHVPQPKLHRIIMRMRMGTRNMSDSMLLWYGTKRNEEARSVRGPHPHYAKKNQTRNEARSTQLQKKKTSKRQKEEEEPRKTTDRSTRSRIIFILATSSSSPLLTNYDYTRSLLCF